MTTFSWVLDSGGAGRGAWQGGVLYEFMQWARAAGCYPSVAVGASAGSYAAADVATGTHETVLKGWARWGLEEVPDTRHELPEFRSLGGLSQFRSHLYHSIRYVMSARELAGVFDTPPESRTRLVVMTTRTRRKDLGPFSRRDGRRYFYMAVTRKLPRSLKYLPRAYRQDPVLFVSHLPTAMSSEFVRPLTRVNYHNVIEASCLVPVAMGAPLQPEELLPIWRGLDPLQQNICTDDIAWEKLIAPYRFEGDQRAVFLDGGFTIKMPFRAFEADDRFRDLAKLLRCDKTVVFCCDPTGRLWETSMRLSALNGQDSVRQAIEKRYLFIISPDHPMEAGFLSTDNSKTMRTFERGREQAKRLLSDNRFLEFLRA